MQWWRIPRSGGQSHLTAPDDVTYACHVVRTLAALLRLLRLLNSKYFLQVPIPGHSKSRQQDLIKSWVTRSAAKTSGLWLSTVHSYVFYGFSPSGSLRKSTWREGSFLESQTPRTQVRTTLIVWNTAPAANQTSSSIPHFKPNFLNSHTRLQACQTAYYPLEWLPTTHHNQSNSAKYRGVYC
jgi:hypothetical protein